MVESLFRHPEGQLLRSSLFLSLNLTIEVLSAPPPLAVFQDGDHLLLLASVLVFLFHFKKLSKHYESEIFHPSSPYRLCLLVGKVFARPYDQQLIQQ